MTSRQFVSGLSSGELTRPEALRTRPAVAAALPSLASRARCVDLGTPGRNRLQAAAQVQICAEQHSEHCGAVFISYHGRFCHTGIARGNHRVN